MAQWYQEGTRWYISGVPGMDAYIVRHPGYYRAFRRPKSRWGTTRIQEDTFTTLKEAQDWVEETVIGFPDRL